MWIPKSLNDEYRTLKRYGNDYLSMPKHYRKFFLLSPRMRHLELKKVNGTCWASPLSSETCPVCNTGVKTDSLCLPGLDNSVLPKARKTSLDNITDIKDFWVK